MVDLSREKTSYEARCAFQRSWLVQGHETLADWPSPRPPDFRPIQRPISSSWEHKGPRLFDLERGPFHSTDQPGVFALAQKHSSEHKALLKAQALWDTIPISPAQPNAWQ